MRIIHPKPLTVAKATVLTALLSAGLLAMTVDFHPAQAFPNKQRECTACHGSGGVAGTVTAVPGVTTPAPGATYTVTITIAPNPSLGDTGYWIANSDATGRTGTSTGVFGGADGSGAATYTATMTAPTAAGTYYYKVWADQGLPNSSARTNFALYQITVGTAPTPTPTPTTPPVTTPPVTTPPVTTPPVTTPPVTTPPVTTPPVTTPPVTTPPVTTPPVTTPPVTPPPASTAHIKRLSPQHGQVGSTVRIRGRGFGRTGTVQFGGIPATVSSWAENGIVVRVPGGVGQGPVPVTVTPAGATPSVAVNFVVTRGHGDDDGDDEDTPDRAEARTHVLPA